MDQDQNPHSSQDAPGEHGQSTVESWDCPSCSSQSSTKFCPSCGERRPHAGLLSIAHFLESVFESFFHADGRFLSTLRALIFRPGELTAAYLIGAHKRYLGPIQLFLIINLVYFLAQSITGWNTFSTPLQIHVGDLRYRELAKAILDSRLEHLHLTYDQFEPIFNHAVGLHAKSLVIIMVPLFALLVGILFWRKKRMVVPHVVFATHFMTFNLLILCLIQILTNVVVMGMGIIGEVPGWQQVDNITTLVLTVIQAVYIFKSTRTVYQQSWWLSALKTTVLTLALSWVVLAFRFLLFLITLYSQ